MSNGYSKGQYGGTPSTSELSDAGFMRDYNAARHDFAPPPPIWSPGSIFRPNEVVDERPVAPSVPSEPFTLNSAVRGFTTAGFVFSLLYVFLVLHPTLSSVVIYAVGGATAGAAAGVCLWFAVKLLQVAVWLLVKALQIGLVVGVIYFLFRAFGS